MVTESKNNWITHTGFVIANLSPHRGFRVTLVFVMRQNDRNLPMTHTNQHRPIGLSEAWLIFPPYFSWRVSNLSMCIQGMPGHEDETPALVVIHQSDNHLSWPKIPNYQQVSQPTSHSASERTCLIRWVWCQHLRDYLSPTWDPEAIAHWASENVEATTFGVLVEAQRSKSHPGEILCKSIIFWHYLPWLLTLNPFPQVKHQLQPKKEKSISKHKARRDNCEFCLAFSFSWQHACTPSSVEP